MKILAFGDLHGDTRLAYKLAQKAAKEKVDLVVLCGDITMAEQETKNLIGPFARLKQKVLLIPGNHETVATADFLAELYGDEQHDVKNLHGYSVVYKDVGFFGCGGANIGLFRVGENEMFNILKKGNENIKGVKKRIMVTHVHPAGTLMEKLTTVFRGSSGVKKAIRELQPDILLCSHVHEAEGLEERVGKTRVINVGKEGKIIEV